MRRENSGGDQTVLVCDGVESFYTGDGHSFYRGSAAVNPDCNFPLSSFYKLRNNPASVSIVGHEHVSLATRDYTCDVLRAEWKLAAIHVIRTMCIDRVDVARYHRHNEARATNGCDNYFHQLRKRSDISARYL